MPWRGPEYEGEFPTLGWEVLEWSTVLPSPRDPSESLKLTDEQARILLRWFAVDPKTGRFLYRRGVSRRSKGWGKSPVEAIKAIAELCGPVRFAGWDAAGNPVGRPWGTHGDPNAWVQIAAVSEDQTENTHSVVYDLLTLNDGRAADELGIDVGLTRSYLRGDVRGKLEPVTAAAGTREGQPVTYGVCDETHLWRPENHGVRLARTLRRNVAKMGGRTYETTNSFVPGERSVAEDSHKAATEGAAGVMYDAVEAPRGVTLDSTDQEIRSALAVAYGDSWWVDLDRLVADIRDPDQPWDDTCRFYLNWNTKLTTGFVEIPEWEALATVDEVPDGAYVGLGFDGSISDDSTALWGCTAEGRLFRVGLWERPKGERDWRVPRLEVEAAVVEAFERFNVGLMLCDPPKWHTEIESWVERWGEDRVLALSTNSSQRFAPLCDRFLTAVNEKQVSHTGDEVLTAHLAACARKKVHLRDDDDDGRTKFVVTKADTRKIDAAIAAILALEAAMTMPELPEDATWFGGWA